MPLCMLSRAFLLAGRWSLFGVGKLLLLLLAPAPPPQLSFAGDPDETKLVIEVDFRRDLLGADSDGDKFAFDAKLFAWTARLAAIFTHFIPYVNCFPKLLSLSCSLSLAKLSYQQ